MHFIKSNFFKKNLKIFFFSKNEKKLFILLFFSRIKKTKLIF